MRIEGGEEQVRGRAAGALAKVVPRAVVPLIRPSSQIGPAGTRQRRHPTRGLELIPRDASLSGHLRVVSVAPGHTKSGYSGQLEATKGWYC